MKIKGSVLKARLGFLAEHAPERGVARVIAFLSPEAVEMCGATGVEGVEEECCAQAGKVCRYRLRWA